LIINIININNKFSRNSHSPHYASCPSVCLCVRLLHTAHNKTKKKQKKMKTVETFPRARVSGVELEKSKVKANFSRSRSTEVKNLHSNLASCLLTGGGSSAGQSAAAEA